MHAQPHDLTGPQLQLVGLLARRQHRHGRAVTQRGLDANLEPDARDTLDDRLHGPGLVVLEQLEFSGSAEPMKEIWIAGRSTLRGLLEEVTLADVASGNLPEHVSALTADPRAWAKR